MDPVTANASKNGRRGATPYAQPDAAELKTEQNPLQFQNNQSPTNLIGDLFANNADLPWWMTYFVCIAAPAYNVGLTALMISKNPIATNLAINSTAPSELSIGLSLSTYRAPQKSPPPDFRKFAVLQSQLQGAMEKSTNTLVAAINIRRSEVAIQDLTTLVKQSSLVGKERLAKNLEEFVEDARKTGRNLQKFGGRVGGAVDETIAMNEYTIELLDRAAKDTSLLTRLLPHAAEARKKHIKSMWIQETRRMKSTIEQLMIEAAANARGLDRLENGLNVIHTIVTRENELVLKGEEALGVIWTALGGNNGEQNYIYLSLRLTFSPAQLAEFKYHGKLLENVSKYRKAAMDHVTGALVHLEQIDLGLKHLNEPVASPLMPGQVGEIPLEVHVTMMRKGTGRLIEVRAREREREDEYMRKMLDNSSL
ncbi:hypothetical protein FRC10_009181 [Ceratobasidium sp. 414]|nr:hypothetical protein FRC10_009181 [Ceratobasidium sp. 414]